MTSQVAIINLALGKLAQDKGISALSDPSKEARVFGKLWEPVRDRVLADRVWPWALKAERLAVQAQEPLPGWALRYARPDDCITAVAITDDNGLRNGRRLSRWCDPHWGLAYRYEYEQSYGDDGTSILTDLEQAWLIYTVRVEDTGRYPPHFVEALACALAVEAAPQIIGDLGLTNQSQLLQKYQFALANAGAHDQNEGRDDRAGRPTALAARDW